jgi:hypothetical protein
MNDPGADGSNGHFKYPAITITILHNDDPVERLCED